MDTTATQQQAPTPINVGDDVLAWTGQVLKVQGVKHDEIRAGSFMVVCASPQAFAPASVRLSAPSLTFKKSGAQYVAAAGAVSCTITKTGYPSTTWTVLAQAGDVRLHTSSRKLETAKQAAAVLVTIVAWHAAGNSWVLPAAGESEEEKREAAAAAEVRRLREERDAEAKALEGHVDFEIPAQFAGACTGAVSVDAVARQVRDVLRARDLLGTSCNDHGKVTVEHSRSGRVTIERTHSAPSVQELAAIVREGVSAAALHSHRVAVTISASDLDDYYAKDAVRILPGDADRVRALVLQGHLSPVARDAITVDRARSISAVARDEEWQQAEAFLPAEWVDLATRLTYGDNAPELLGLAFRAILGAQLADDARVTSLIASGSSTSRAIATVQKLDWVADARKGAAVQAAPVAEAGEVLDHSAQAAAFRAILGAEAKRAAAPVVEEAAPVASLPTSGPLAEYLGRLLHVPKRQYAQALALALLTGGEEPQAPAAEWSQDVARKVRRYLAVVAA